MSMHDRIEERRQDAAFRKRIWARHNSERPLYDRLKRGPHCWECLRPLSEGHHPDCTAR